MSGICLFPTKNSPTPLQILQAEFAILELSGKHAVIQHSDLAWKPGMKTAPQLRLYQGADGKLVLRRRIEKISATNHPNELINDFFNNPQTPVYKNIAFSPLPQPMDTLNLWIGSTILPKQGSWLTVMQFLRDVICSGDQNAYEYLIHYIAHAIQKPEEKPGIMVVLLGGEGIGKGTVEQILRRIFSATTLLVSDVNSVVGRFNAVLERSYIVYMDEAVFKGDIRLTERLKSFVTSQHIQIEEKHQPERSIESYHRFFSASNAKHFAQIDPDNRRMFYLKVSEQFKGNTRYWDNLYAAMSNGEMEAMAYDMMQIDLSSFHIRNRPESSELLIQKIESLPSFERFWFDCLWKAETCSLSAFYKEIRHEDWRLGGFWPTQDILDCYLKIARSAQRYQSVTSKNISDSLEKICPSVNHTRKSISGSRSWGYDLPTIEIARKEFEVYLGGSKIDWPDLEGQDDYEYPTT
jgi:hypothetical protein